MIIKEVIVVEGKKDTMKIRLAVDADTIETNGSAVSRKTLDMIRHAKEKRGVIIFTDPDYPGQRIRKIIDQEISGCKHAFLPKESAMPKRDGASVGIEHASIEAIQHALANVHSNTDKTLRQSDIERNDIIRYGLLGGKDSKARRKALGDYFHIGYANGKQLLHRLQMFGITIDELNHAMLHIIEREDIHE